MPQLCDFATIERMRGFSEPPASPWVNPSRSSSGDAGGSALAGLAGTTFASQRSPGLPGRPSPHASFPGRAIRSAIHLFRLSGVSLSGVLQRHSAGRGVRQHRPPPRRFGARHRRLSQSPSSREPNANSEPSAQAWSFISICCPRLRRSVGRRSPISRLRLPRTWARQPAPRARAGSENSGVCPGSASPISADPFNGDALELYFFCFSRTTH